MVESYEMNGMRTVKKAFKAGRGMNKAWKWEE